MIMGEERPYNRVTNYYAIRTVAGQELNVALLIENRVKVNKLDVRSIIVPPAVKGYVILEAPGLHVVYEAIREIKHVKGQAPGKVDVADVESMLLPRPVIKDLKVDDIVEIISGPFKGFKAKVVRIEYSKNEVVLNILESDYQLQITTPGDYVRLIRRSKEGGEG